MQGCKCHRKFSNSRESVIDFDLRVLHTATYRLIQEYKMGSIGVQDVMTIKYVLLFFMSSLSINTYVPHSHISPLVFTLTLLPLLRATSAHPDSDVRIVTVTSFVHSNVKPAMLPHGFKTREDFNGPDTKEEREKKGDTFQLRTNRYGLSKLANILATRVLGEKLSTEASRNGNGRDVLALSVHPAAVATEGNYTAAATLPWPFSLLARAFVSLIFDTPAQGARCIVDAATAPEFRSNHTNSNGDANLKEEYQGAYLESKTKVLKRLFGEGGGKVSVRRGDLSELAKDENLARECWALTERVLREEGIEVEGF